MSEKVIQWIEKQSFLAVFITSWMIINWDIVILLLFNFNNEKLKSIYEIMHIQDKQFILNFLCNKCAILQNYKQFGWLLIYDITLPFALTWFRMKFIKNISIRLEKMSETEKAKATGELDELTKEIKKLNATIEICEEFRHTIMNDIINKNLLNNVYIKISDAHKKLEIDLKTLEYNLSKQ